MQCQQTHNEMHYWQRHAFEILLVKIGPVVWPVAALKNKLKSTDQ